MKRSTKNIIMIFMILLLVLISFLIINDQKNHNHPEINRNENTTAKAESKEIENNEIKNNDETKNEETNENENQSINKQPGMDRRDMNRGSRMQQDMILKHDFKCDEKHSNINIFICIGLLIAIIIMYLVMSNFNAKSMKETFTGMDNIIIFILATVIISATLTVVQSLLVNHKPNMPIQMNQTTIKNTD